MLNRIGYIAIFVVTLGMGVSLTQAAVTQGYTPSPIVSPDSEQTLYNSSNDQQPIINAGAFDRLDKALLPSSRSSTGAYDRPAVKPVSPSTHDPEALYPATYQKDSSAGTDSFSLSQDNTKPTLSPYQATESAPEASSSMTDLYFYRDDTDNTPAAKSYSTGQGLQDALLTSMPARQQRPHRQPISSATNRAIEYQLPGTDRTNEVNDGPAPIDAALMSEMVYSTNRTQADDTRSTNNTITHPDGKSGIVDDISGLDRSSGMDLLNMALLPSLRFGRSTDSPAQTDRQDAPLPEDPTNSVDSDDFFENPFMSSEFAQRYVGNLDPERQSKLFPAGSAYERLNQEYQVKIYGKKYGYGALYDRLRLSSDGIIDMGLASLDPNTFDPNYFDLAYFDPNAYDPNLMYVYRMTFPGDLELLQSRPAMNDLYSSNVVYRALHLNLPGYYRTSTVVETGPFYADHAWRRLGLDHSLLWSGTGKPPWNLGTYASSNYNSGSFPRRPDYPGRRIWEYPGPEPEEPIPEPATVLLLSSGGVWALRRRQSLKPGG